MVYKKNKTRRGLNKKRKQRTRKNLKISKIASQIKKSLKNIQFGGDDHKHGQVGGGDGNVSVIKVENTTYNDKNGIAITFFVAQTENTVNGKNQEVPSREAPMVMGNDEEHGEEQPELLANTGTTTSQKNKSSSASTRGP